MASPLPESRAPADAKPLDAVTEKEKEVRPEANGHQSPPRSESPRVESQKPLPNGSTNGKASGSVEDRSATNGTPKEDEAMTDANEAVPAPATESSESKPAEEKSEVADPTSKPDGASEPKPAPEKPLEPESPKDVEMSEAQTADDTPANPEQSSNNLNNYASAESVPKSPTQAPATGLEPTSKPQSDSPTAKSPTAFPQTTEPGSEDTVATPEAVGMSQLAIESTNGDTSNVEASVEVPMTDAPTGKITREREDDTTEEPAAKRAKTEPEEDDTVEPTPIAMDGGSATYPKATFDEFENWNSPENDAKRITQHRIREIRKVIARIKKTKAGGGFRDSVQKLWPVLWDKYSARIEKPMDLSQIDKNVRAENYATFGDLKADLALILENSQQFNGPNHEVTHQARSALWTLWVDIERIGEEEPTKPKQPPKAPRSRESRSAFVKPEEATTPEVGSAGAPGGSIGVVPAPPPGAVKPVGSNARRASTATEGDRPKRTVRPPKSKDIEYSSKPSRKKLKPELQFCDEVLQELMSPKHWGANKWFLEAVDAEGLGIPDYYSVIKHPMDLGKISKMLGSGEIASLKDFEKNVTLMFNNCYQFNGQPDQGGVSIFAKQLQDIFTAQMKGKDAWLTKHAKANPPPTSVSNASDEEEDEEEEEEDVADASAAADTAREVKELEARLREETDKQNAFFSADQPNQSMIDIQQGIVKVVQEALLKAKSKLNEFRKNGGGNKPAKKAKPAKSRASIGGGGAARKSGGGAGAGAPPPKKAAHPKKKKKLTVQDKDHIANAINDLEGQHLDRAIDIIKRDTGQMESDQGELELDIDQLSAEALLKLWELCKKVLPGFGKDPNAAPSSPELPKSAPAKQAAKAASKSKKNKPMSAREQEDKIARLKEIQGMYQGQDPSEGALTQHSPVAEESSDDSSEEE